MEPYSRRVSGQDAKNTVFTVGPTKVWNRKTTYKHWLLTYYIKQSKKQETRKLCRIH